MSPSRIPAAVVAVTHVNTKYPGAYTELVVAFEKYEVSGCYCVSIDVTF
jgi:hypothetical protein